MTPWRKAIETILSHSFPTDSERSPLAHAHRRRLARDVAASHDSPSFDNSAMDGFAVRTIEAKRGSILKVLDEIPAGGAPNKKYVDQGAVRVMTGGEVPADFDAVIRQEDIEKISEVEIRIGRPPHVGEHIRKRGEEFKMGETLLTRGEEITPSIVGILASLGYAQIDVQKIPTISILPTGNELTEPGEESNGSIFNSNSPMLAALLERDGASAQRLPIARDHRAQLKSALSNALNADILLTSGGVSVGKYDLVREILEELGVNILFHKVAIKPGKPLLFGVREKPRKTLIFGLPGNPVSTYVTYEMFVRCALRKMSGQTPYEYPLFDVVLEETVPKKPGLTHFVPSVIRWENGIWKARTTGTQGSHRLTSISHANSFLILEEESEGAKPGEQVSSVWFDFQQPIDHQS